MKNFRFTKISLIFISLFISLSPSGLASQCEPDLNLTFWKKDGQTSIQNQNISGECITKFMSQLVPSDFEIRSEDFGEYKWFDVNNDGTLELFITTTSGRGFFNDLWIFLSDNGHKKFLQHEHVWMLDELDSGLRDFEGDGVYELVARIYLAGDGGLARPMAIWTAIFQWNGSKFERADQLYKDFYVEKLPELESRIKEVMQERYTRYG